MAKHLLLILILALGVGCNFQPSDSVAKGDSDGICTNIFTANTLKVGGKTYFRYLEDVIDDLPGSPRAKPHIFLDNYDTKRATSMVFVRRDSNGENKIYDLDLEWIGSGSFNHVFKTDDDKVIKLQKPPYISDDDYLKMKTYGFSGGTRIKVLATLGGLKKIQEAPALSVGPLVPGKPPTPTDNLSADALSAFVDNLSEKLPKMWDNGGDLWHDLKLENTILKADGTLDIVDMGFYGRKTYKDMGWAYDEDILTLHGFSTYFQIAIFASLRPHKSFTDINETVLRVLESYGKNLENPDARQLLENGFIKAKHGMEKLQELGVYKRLKNGGKLQEILYITSFRGLPFLAAQEGISRLGRRDYLGTSYPKFKNFLDGVLPQPRSLGLVPGGFHQ